MSKAEILIIDDEPQIRKMLEITLQTNGYLSKSAVSAKEGLIMAANHPPELILLDLGLPDENGHMVLQKLRQWYTNPVIILSVQKNEEDIIKALTMVQMIIYRNLSVPVNYWPVSVLLCVIQLQKKEIQFLISTIFRSIFQQEQ